MSNAVVLRGRSSASGTGSFSANVLIAGLINLPLLRCLALPLSQSSNFGVTGDGEGSSPEDPELWIYLSVALVLVLLGGIFAGLTIAYIIPYSLPF